MKFAWSEWSLTVNNFVATNTQWKSWCTARILCFNKTFIRNGTISTEIPNLRVWCKKWSNWTSGVGFRQKIQLRLLVFLRIRLHPEIYHSESATLVTRNKPRNTLNRAFVLCCTVTQLFSNRKDKKRRCREEPVSCRTLRGGSLCHQKCCKRKD